MSAAGRGLRDALQALYDSHGMLTPTLVVDEARDPGHPLHSHFEWDDARAAEEYRLEQARGLIQKVKIVYRSPRGRSPERLVRAYHSVPDVERGRVYRSAEDIAEDPLLREMVLRDMERDWKQLKTRYEHFAEFAEMVLRDMVA